MAETQLVFIKEVLSALMDAEQNSLLADHRADGLDGLSGLKTVGALQRLVKLISSDPSACYLEIGVFQGLTLVSASLEAPDMPCLGIDNFATLDPESQNLSVVEDRVRRFKATNATLINADFEEALERLDEHLDGRKVSVYFIDGPHDYRSQIVCLLSALRHLHDNSVILIDDANYPDVRQSTRDFLVGYPEFKMIFEAYSPDHPANMSDAERKRWEDGWLNGIQVLVRDTDGILPNMLPPVDADRTLYFNEWLAHRLQLAELAPEALSLARAICLEDGEGETEARRILLERYKTDQDKYSERHADRNVYSKGLTEGRFTDYSG